MEKYMLDRDIHVLGVKAKSFPEGIEEAFQKLHSLFPFGKERYSFGISQPNREGTIIYSAAIEEKSKDEAEKYGCKTFTIKRGLYISTLIKNYLNNLPCIGDVFQEMITQPGIDPEGYCIEWYLNENEVRCMVKLEE